MAKIIKFDFSKKKPVGSPIESQDIDLQSDKVYRILESLYPVKVSFSPAFLKSQPEKESQRRALMLLLKKNNPLYLSEKVVACLQTCSTDEEKQIIEVFFDEGISQKEKKQVKSLIDLLVDAKSSKEILEKHKEETESEIKN